MEVREREQLDYDLRQLRAAIARLTAEHDDLVELINQAKFDMMEFVKAHSERITGFKSELFADLAREKTLEMQATTDKAIACTKAAERCEAAESRIQGMIG